MNADTLDDAVARSAIQDALDELGAGLTADSVAQRLLDAGIKGRRASAKHCPVARYLQQRTGRQELRITTDGVHTPSVVCTTCPPEKDECMPLSSPLPGITMPLPVREFIQRFDRGAFPDLVDTAV